MSRPNCRWRNGGISVVVASPTPMIGILLDSISVTSRSCTARFNASAAKYPAVPPPTTTTLRSAVTFGRASGTAAVATGGAGAKRSATALAADGNALAAPSIGESSIALMRCSASRKAGDIGSVAGCPPYEMAKLVERS